MEVLDACHNAGVEVVATMCDVGSSNVQVLKHFGLSEKMYFFLKKEFAAPFDLLHLFKCTYSLVQKHDVADVECQITVNGKHLTGTAKREDVLKVHEVDKRIVYCLLLKVT